MAVFDKYVYEILKNPTYLTERNTQDLLTLFPSYTQKAEDLADKERELTEREAKVFEKEQKAALREAKAKELEAKAKELEVKAREREREVREMVAQERERQKELKLQEAREREARAKEAPEPDIINDGKPIPLRTYINKMLKSLETQQSNVLSSEDPRDHKMIFDGYGKIITMLMKHNEAIDIQERAQKIEEAVVSALEKTAEEHGLPELMQTFLAQLDSQGK